MTAFWEWIRSLARAKKARNLDPDGHALARLLAAQSDPIEVLKINSKEMRADIERSTTLMVVGRPEAIKKLRDAGYMKDAPEGEVFEGFGRRLVFFGYSDRASMDDQHWGLELRRITGAERAQKEKRALEAQIQTEESPRVGGKKTKRARRV